MTRARLIALSVGLCFLGGCASAQQPAQNIDPARHGNLASAQTAIEQAYSLTERAQAENHDHMGGHADRAKQLLREAADELKQAALTLNAR